MSFTLRQLRHTSVISGFPLFHTSHLAHTCFVSHHTCHVTLPHTSAISATPSHLPSHLVTLPLVTFTHLPSHFGKFGNTFTPPFTRGKFGDITLHTSLHTSSHSHVTFTPLPSHFGKFGSTSLHTSSHLPSHCVHTSHLSHD